jgi:hypothetical protein
MRELVLLASLALAALLGMAIGFAFSRPAKVPPVTFATDPVMPTASAAAAMTSVTHIERTVAPAWDALPVTTYNWRSEDKDEIVRGVQRLSPSDADFVCLVLGLIPTDEVFDKINAKGRLIRYIKGLTTPAELRDLEAAFRQLEPDRVSR